jgi:hypothetical protein
MAKSVLEYLGTGGATSYIVFYEIDTPSNFYPHGYLNRDHILVYDENDVVIPFVWDTPTGNTITLTYDNGERFFVRRKTPRDELYVEWDDGAILHDRNLTAAHLQHLMITEEMNDGFIFGIEDPDNSLLPVIFRGIRVPDEVAPIDVKALLTPHIADRKDSFFAWDTEGNIWAIPVEDLLALIGGSTAQPGRGLIGRNIGADVIAFDVDAPADGLAYVIKDNVWIRPEASDILYDSDNETIPDGTVQDAMRLMGFLILALTAGVRFRGTWDAATNTPDLDNELRRTGDYWRVTVAGSTPLTDPDGIIISSWSVGESALWSDVDHDDDEQTPNKVGWNQLPVAERLPADNIDVDQDVHPLALTSQEEHEASYGRDVTQDGRLDLTEADILANAAQIATNVSDIASNAAAIAANLVLINANTLALDGKSDTGHTHAYGDITGKPATFPPSTHNHTAAETTSGIFAGARIPFAIVNGASGKVNLELSGNVLNIRTSD